MYGLFISKVTCPDPKCHKQSTTIEPFSTVTLSIPIIEIKEIEFYFLYEDYFKAPLNVTLFFNSNCHTIKDVKQILANYL